MAQALTKTTEEGEQYSRPPKIEASIHRALAEDLTIIKSRLRVGERSSPDHIPSECLVHLIRDAKRRGDIIRMNTLFPVLIARCNANLEVNLADSRLPDPDFLREDILGQFAELFADDGIGARPDELDFFECKFNLAFRAFRIDLMNNELAYVEPTAVLPRAVDDGDTVMNSIEDVFVEVSEAFRTSETPETVLALAIITKAIGALPRDERDAVVLCHVLGYKEESDNPEVETAATRLNVSGRTIRNRLKRAALKLSHLMEDV